MSCELEISYAVGTHVHLHGGHPRSSSTGNSALACGEPSGVIQEAGSRSSSKIFKCMCKAAQCPLPAHLHAVSIPRSRCQQAAATATTTRERQPSCVGSAAAFACSIECMNRVGWRQFEAMKPTQIPD
jgi:hypothetical protein